MAKAAKRPARRTKAPARRSKPAAVTPQKVAYGSEPGFPISMAMRAGDFVFTSAQADHGFNPSDVVYDEKGLVVSDGNTLPPRSMARGDPQHLAATSRRAWRRPAAAWRMWSTPPSGCAIRAISRR